MKKLIFGLIVLVLGVTVGTYVFRSEVKPTQVTGTGGSEVATLTPATESAQPVATATVTLTDNGFVPKALTVKAGTTVKFTNGSGRQMWVASNPHPTHTLLPGFDELTAVGKGGSYDYQFTKVGTWGYHNHLSPQIGGTVVVTE